MVNGDAPEPDTGRDKTRESSLLSRITVYPLPPKGFHLLDPPLGDYKEYGLLPPPDPVRQRDLYAHWLRVFSPPFTFIPPVPRISNEAFRINVSYDREPVAAALSGSRYENSGNWSGAYVVPTNTQICVLVAGLWTVPAVALPPPSQQQTNATQYACSTWVGLDGQRRYLNSSLPQIGTMQILNITPNGMPQTTVIPFFQWWDIETNGQFIELAGLTVQPSDLMVGLVWVNSPTSVIAYLRNITTGQMTYVGCSAPLVSVDGVNVQLTVSGATAEWIVERPTEFCTTNPYPFPDYEQTTFCECWAGLAPGAGAPHAFEELTTARLIRMFDVLPDPTRTVLISMAQQRSKTAVSLAYGGFRD